MRVFFGWLKPYSGKLFCAAKPIFLEINWIFHYNCQHNDVPILTVFISSKNCNFIMWQLNCLPKDTTERKIQPKCRECCYSSDLLKHFDFVLVWFLIIKRQYERVLFLAQKIEREEIQKKNTQQKFVQLKWCYTKACYFLNVNKIIQIQYYSIMHYTWQ